MKFKLESTCLKCGSHDNEAELGMGQGSGYLAMECRNCGEEEIWDDQGRGVRDIEFAFDVGNGIESEPWTIKRVESIIQQKAFERTSLGVKSERLYISEEIWDMLVEESYLGTQNGIISDLKVYLLNTDEEIIEVGG